MALIPPEYLNAVVALGELTNNEPVEFTGTGFLYGHPVGSDPSDGQIWFKVFLVTNHHVVDGAVGLVARFNRSMNTESQLVPLPLTAPDGSALWTLHPNGEDVAVIPINTRELSEQRIEFAVFQREKNGLSRAQALEAGIGEGDGVFVLGFPLGLAGDERNYVIARQGIIARIQDWLNEQANYFLIDASVFPGNSGGPVLTKPESVQIIGTQSFIRFCLIGMVSSYLPYEEVAVSLQTGRRRVIFQENSALGIVVPTDVIQETVETALSNLTVEDSPGSDTWQQQG